MLEITDVSPYLTGAADVEHTGDGVLPHRLPQAVRSMFPDPLLLAMESQPSGVTLRFRTAAGRIELDLHATRMAYVGAVRPRGRVDLVANGTLIGSVELRQGDAYVTDMRTGTTTAEPGTAETLVFDDLPEGEATLELWLPHNETVRVLALRTDAPITAVQDQRPLWVHYGSSISQGSNAASPTSIWPAIAATTVGVQLRNLGFGGSAQLDLFIARLIRDSDADVISLKVGINLVNLDAMRVRTFGPALHGFLDTIRDGHPDTPILLTTPIYCGVHEDTPGPGAVDIDSLGTDQVRFMASGTPGDTALGRLTLQVIREVTTDVASRRADERLHLVDGLSLYGPEESVLHPLPDGLHPDTAAHGLIGDRFADHLARAVGTGVPD